MTTSGAQFWDERYRSMDQVWSGRPNPQLVAEAADLPPGTALDVGCGEGGDAVWLAGRGWQVSAVDLSDVAVARGAAHAETLGPDVAGRIQWRQADLTTWRPPVGAFDLVSSQFMHVLPAELDVIFSSMADAVAAGGTLLIVGHAPSDLLVVPRPLPPDVFYTADQVAAALPATDWDIVAADSRAREVPGPEGHDVVVHDTVLRARRRA